MTARPGSVKTAGDTLRRVSLNMLGRAASEWTDTPADGDCAIHAVFDSMTAAHGLLPYRRPSMRALRNTLATLMELNRSLRHFTDDTVPPNAYRSAKDGGRDAWVGMTALQALSLLLGHPIAVIHDHTGEIHLHYFGKVYTYPCGKEICCDVKDAIVILYDGSVHYHKTNPLP